MPFKFRRLSEESTDEVDHEIEEILHEAEPLGVEIKTESKIEHFEHLETEKESPEADTDRKSLTPETPTPFVHKIPEIEPPQTLESKPITAEATVIEAKPIIDDQTLPTENIDEKPPVPIPTYLWEDVKRSKEQVSGDNVCTIQLFRTFRVTKSSDPRLTNLSVNLIDLLLEFVFPRAATHGRTFIKNRSDQTKNHKAF